MMFGGSRYLKRKFEADDSEQCEFQSYGANDDDYEDTNGDGLTFGVRLHGIGSLDMILVCLAFG